MRPSQLASVLRLTRHAASSIHQTLTLHPLEEFKELAPEELRTPEILEDAHQLRLARLRFELLERKRCVAHSLSHAALAHPRHHRLAAEKRSLRSTRAALRAQVKEKRAAVQEVVAEITALVEVSRARRRGAELLLMPLAPRRRQRRSRSG